MIVAAHQPQFIPWLGYFDKMLQCDLFVLLDDVQFKKNEWQNRNKIWSREGGQWLTVPVIHHFPSEIREVSINNTSAWKHKHAATLRQTYAHARFFDNVWPVWQKMYDADRTTLLDINLYSIDRLREALEVKTPMRLSSELGVEGRSTERLVNLCGKLGADTYLAGAGGKDYMDMALFEKAGIKVSFQDYPHPVYAQFDEVFVSHLSALDVVFHHGPAAPQVLRSSRAPRASHSP